MKAEEVVSLHYTVYTAVLPRHLLAHGTHVACGMLKHMLHAACYSICGGVTSFRRLRVFKVLLHVSANWITASILHVMVLQPALEVKICLTVTML